MANFILERFRQEKLSGKISTLIWFIVCCQMMFFIDMKLDFWYGVIYIFVYAFVMSCYTCMTDEMITLEFDSLEFKRDIYMTFTTSYALFQIINLISLIFLFYKNELVMKGTFIINLIFIIMYMFLFYAFQNTEKKK